jgi:hypothetical protein
MSRLRRLPLIAAVALAAACSSTLTFSADGTPVHWQQNVAGSLERRIDVVVPAAIAVDPAFARGLDAGIAQANRSPYLQLTLVIRPTCRTGRHCITIARAPMNGAVAAVGWDDHGHIYGHGASLTFDSAPWPPAVLANATCHELYHAAGLDHGDEPGPCQSGIATDVDLANVATATGHPDPVLYASATRGPTLHVVAHDTRAQLTAATWHR